MIEIDRATHAQALIAAGHNPAPYIGQRWHDRSVTWLPKGHRHVVTIKSMDVITGVGWQVTVERRQIDAEGNIVTDGSGEGVIFVHRLFDQFVPLPDLHILQVSDVPGGLRYRLECPQLTDECRSYVEGSCPQDCPVQSLDDDSEQWDEDLIEAHGVQHRLFDGSWLAATGSCFYVTHYALADLASDLRDSSGNLLGPGRYRVWCDNEDGAGGEFMKMGLGA